MRVLALVLILCSASVAVAQPTVRSAEMRLTAPDAELWRGQRRARLMLAVGAGLAAGSAVHLAWAARDRTCGYGHVMNNSLYTAGVMGAVGVSVALGGGAWLAVSSARHEYLHASRAQKWIVAGASMLGFTLSTIVTTFVWGMDSVGCST